VHLYPRCIVNVEGDFERVWNYMTQVSTVCS
jgi:hypothetical protein